MPGRHGGDRRSRGNPSRCLPRARRAAWLVLRRACRHRPGQCDHPGCPGRRIGPRRSRRDEPHELAGSVSADHSRPDHRRPARGGHPRDREVRPLKAIEQRPDPAELLRQISIEGRRRAALRVYLGYARGCGTSTAMLDEVRRRQSRGADVVVAAYQVHDDAAESLGGLDVIHATRELPQIRDLDVAAVLARNPEVACIDDLMGLDSDGRPRIESVPRLLEAGIVVLATLHLLSVRGAAGAIAGFLGEQPPEPLLGDEIFDLIDELEYVDITPDDLLSRIRMHTILTPAQLAIGMQRELRPAVLTMLRETALRVTADHADRKLSSYLPSTESPLEFRGRIVLWLAVVTVRTRRLGDQEKGTLGSYASLAHQLGGEFVRLEGRNIGRTLVRYIRDVKATEVVLGRRRHSRRLPWDTTSEIIGGLSGVDVHILRSGQPHADQAITAS
ncbi:MAG: hypothetical protein E6J53_04670 [Chloroflexi bacterium]|nr:MAG: hypothetical protein E6J53_04670 [Chloroflexota bacterium]